MTTINSCLCGVFLGPGSWHLLRLGGRCMFGALLRSAPSCQARLLFPGWDGSRKHEGFWLVGKWCSTISRPCARFSKLNSAESWKHLFYFNIIQLSKYWTHYLKEVGHASWEVIYFFPGVKGTIHCGALDRPFHQMTHLCYPFVPINCLNYIIRIFINPCLYSFWICV